MGKAFKNIIPAGHLQVRDNVLAKGNLTGLSEKKDLWAGNLNLPKQAEYTFFAGCGFQHMKYVEGMMGALKSAGKLGIGVGKAVGISKAFGKVGINLTGLTAKATASKEDPYTPVLVNSVNILKKLGITVGYLGDDEPCCGSPMYYAGFEDDYAKNARESYKKFKEAGVKKIIGLIPACTSSIKNNFPNYVDDFDLEVYHILEVIARQLQNGQAKPKAGKNMTVTYHDPCQLSRYMKITKEPRQILRSIEGIELVEPDAEEIGRWSTCCGGGNMETTHPELSARIGERRLEALQNTGASVIVTNCPACEMQLRHMVKKTGAKTEVMDIMQLLDESL